MSLDIGQDITLIIKLYQLAAQYGYTLVPTSRIKTIASIQEIANIPIARGDIEGYVEYVERTLLQQTATEIVNKLREYKKLLIKRMPYNRDRDTYTMIVKFDVIVPDNKEPS